MPVKVMLEATQSVVAGNDVAVHSGELFDPAGKVPEGVTVRAVLVDVPDVPAEPEADVRPGVAEADQQPRRAVPAKAAGK